MKKKFYTEIAYFIGIILIAFSAALVVKSNFGVSMVVAPAYLIYLKLSQYWTWFTFGMAEYIFQGLLLIFTIIFVRKFHYSYLFSFITAVYYGLMLDLFLFLMNLISYNAFWLRFIYFILGVVICAFGVALMFNTYISPEVYELFVKESSKKYGWKLSKVKFVYDCSSCVIGIMLSFIFFGWFHFEGVKWGTIIAALTTGPLISLFGKLFDKCFDFKDGLKLRKYFTDKQNSVE